MIDILLSTYNGQKYINEQLDSILNQSCSDWQLIIRDDGSSDETVSLIKLYRDKCPAKIKIISDNYKNVGVIRSFELLLEQSTSEYIMFCDQDDVWLQKKIELTYNKIKQLELEAKKDIPILVHTDLSIVDKKLTKIHNSFWQYAKLKPEMVDHNIHYLMVCNTVTGCTMMMNKKAKKISLPFPENTEMHDSWIALCVAKNGKLDFLNEATILYRQHDFNVVGSELKKPLLKKIKNIRTLIDENKKRYNLFKQLEPSIFPAKYLYYKLIFLIQA